MSENEIAKIIVDTSYKIHQSLGPGLLESVYERILVYELENCGLGCCVALLRFNNAIQSL